MYKCALPKPHESKLLALANNTSLPSVDTAKVEEAIVRYKTWVAAMDALDSEGDVLLGQLIDLLNAYKRWIEVDLIFCSPADFLYRQKGQHKVDNSVSRRVFAAPCRHEAFSPARSHLEHCAVRPQAAFAAFVFAGSAHTPLNDGGIFVKKKTKITRSRRRYISRHQVARIRQMQKPLVRHGMSHTLLQNAKLTSIKRCLTRRWKRQGH